MQVPLKFLPHDCLSVMYGQVGYDNNNNFGIIYGHSSPSKKLQQYNNITVEFIMNLKNVDQL